LPARSGSVKALLVMSFAIGIGLLSSSSTLAACPPSNKTLKITTNGATYTGPCTINTGTSGKAAIIINADNVTLDNFVGISANGSALMIKGANTVTVKNCTFRDSKIGVYLPRGSGNSTSNVTIRDSLIYNTKSDGIQSEAGDVDGSGSTNSNLKILYNTIYNTGTRLYSASYRGHQHGIYIQTPGYTISDNLVYDSNDGSAISVRAAGIVRRNKAFDTYVVPIGYYSNHPAGTGEVLIENNIAYKTNGDLKDGVVAIWKAVGVGSLASTIKVRFNTLVVNGSTNGSWCITINQAVVNSSNVRIYGNLLANQNGSSLPVRYIGDNTTAITPDYGAGKNRQTTSLADFVSPRTGNYHLKSISAAIDAATNIEAYPTLDFDEQNRNNEGYDFGADEYW